MDVLKAKQIKTILQQHDSAAHAFSASSSDDNDDVDEEQAAAHRRVKQESHRRESTASEERWANAVAVNLGPSIWGSGAGGGSGGMAGGSHAHLLLPDRGRASRSASFSVGQESHPSLLGPDLHPFNTPATHATSGQSAAAYDGTRLLREQFQQMKFKNRSKSSYAAAWHVPDLDNDGASEDAVYDESEGLQESLQAQAMRMRQAHTGAGLGATEPPGLRYTTPTNPRLDDLRADRRRASFNSVVSFSSAEQETTAPRLGMFAGSRLAEPTRRESLGGSTQSPGAHGFSDAQAQGQGQAQGQLQVQAQAQGQGQAGYGAMSGPAYGGMMADVDRYFSSDEHRQRANPYSHPQAPGQQPSQQHPGGSHAQGGHQQQQGYPLSPDGSQQQQQVPGPLFLVEFKACRLDIFYLPEGSGLTLHVGDLVLVEADRGRDLGKVTQTNLTPAQARQVKVQQAREQALALGTGVDDLEQTQSQGGGPSSGLAPLQPKLIYRPAQPNEVAQLLIKSQDEQQAMLVCQAKVRQRKSPMEVLDGEYQWDRRKLTFYYLASQRIDFRDLVRDLFKIYKTRIWMCAVNPASVGQSHHTGIAAQIRVASPGVASADAQGYSYTTTTARPPTQQAYGQPSLFQQQYASYAGTGYMVPDAMYGYGAPLGGGMASLQAPMQFGDHPATFYPQVTNAGQAQRSATPGARTGNKQGPGHY